MCCHEAADIDGSVKDLIINPRQRIYSISTNSTHIEMTCQDMTRNLSFKPQQAEKQLQPSIIKNKNEKNTHYPKKNNNTQV